ncbi:pre-mRNA-splicing factor SPF27 [Ischnura elegans]|uniref:pre-mRNA-splicing factor SPF27 n=1 Tax=Ischnura elegans TaxID=197161 RepID=UPI001ED88B88|nr:pre-mRNA-splicing factor SPF27 [Ischnura elegans]
MAGEVLVDALPYIDQGYDEPGVREAALAMVEEETRRYRPTKNYLEHIPTLNLSAFETEIMRSEFERMQQRQPMDVLSMKRYELPPPPAGKLTDIAAWTECVDNSMAQLEHQATRICNLELMLEYGCEAWKSYLTVLVKLSTQAQKQLQAVRKQIQETNWERKNMQTTGGERLRALEASWVSLVSKNYEIEQACAQMEKELSNAQRKKQMQEEALEGEGKSEEGPTTMEEVWEAAEREERMNAMDADEAEEDEDEDDERDESPERRDSSPDRSETPSPRRDDEDDDEEIEDRNRMEEDDDSR